MSKNKLISIIIPAHNEESYLKSTINSLLNQTYQNFEVIIVLNSCTDKSLDIVNNIKKNNSKKDLITHNIRIANVSLARNVGVDLAKGEILIFLDADTTLEKNSLEIIQKQFTSQISVASTKVKPDSKNLSLLLLMKFKNFYHTYNLYHGSSGIIICHKNQFDKIGGFKEDLIVKENRDLIKKLTKIGKYKCINCYATTSMRRFNKWGLLKSSFFWIKQLNNERKGQLHKSSYDKIR